MMYIVMEDVVAIATNAVAGGGRFEKAIKAFGRTHASIRVGCHHQHMIATSSCRG